jgi:hypothetical protein
VSGKGKQHKAGPLPDTCCFPLADTCCLVCDSRIVMCCIPLLETCCYFVLGIF